MKLVIAGKPSVAQSLAKVIGANKRCDGCLEGSGRSDFRANLEISALDRVITLSTCAYRLENARYVQHGKLVELN